MDTTKKRLLIISDSAMSYCDGVPCAFGPVVVEVQYFLNFFDSITWIGSQREQDPTFYKLPKDRVILKMLPEVKGRGIVHKLGVLFQYPNMFRLLKHEIRKHEAIHVRAPSHPAMVAMVLAKRYPQKRFWFKYAGSWVDPASRMYDLQRKRLKKMPAHCVVTVNGQWPDQPENILAFENPCLTDVHRKLGRQRVREREEASEGTLDFCFVGGFNENKGIVPLLKVWSTLEHPRLGKLFVVGQGPLEKQVRDLAIDSKNEVELMGLISKEEVHGLYAKCFGVILPTCTEGFPKVIGEAMNYGCLPIVSNISCLGQYIQTGINGVLLEEVSEATIKKGILDCLRFDKNLVRTMREKNFHMAQKFTYDLYTKRLNEELFPKILKRKA